MVGKAPYIVFRLDYVSCLLTVLSTVLVGRKLWTGFLVAGVNSVIICVIGLRTAQLGLIPANVFCIAVYAVSIRSWIREQAQSPRSAVHSESTPISEAAPH